jgi:hypothetical protein
VSSADGDPSLGPLVRARVLDLAAQLKLVQSMPQLSKFKGTAVVTIG